MKECKSKRMLYYYNSYNSSRKYLLTDCYKKPSIAKKQAFIDCLYLMSEYKGHCLRIITYNTQMFTAGFIGQVDGKTVFVLITKSYVKYMYVNPLTSL